MDDRRERFESQVLPYLDDAYRFARWLSYSHGDADDIVQDAMLRAFRAFGSLRGSDVKVWLLAIIRNCYRSAYAQQQRRSMVPIPEESDEQDGYSMVAATGDPELAAITVDDGRTLEQILASLPEEYREVIVLRELEEMNYREISEVMNVPMGTVMSRLARARTMLRARCNELSRGEPRAMR